MESIKDEREVIDESYDNDDNMAQDDPNDVYYEDKTTDEESDYSSDDSFESIPKKKSKTKIKLETITPKPKTPAKPKKSPASSTSLKDTPSTSKQIKTEKKLNKTVYTPLAPVPPVLLQPVRATSTITTASSMVIAQLQQPTEQNNGDASIATTAMTATTTGEAQVKTEPKQRKKYEKLPKQCTVCGLIVRRLRDHMKGHPDALEFKCQHCNRKYLTQAGLERHMDTQHADR